MKHTPENIQNLTENQVIVVGTNRAGIHGAGAAKLANKKFGLTWGKTGLVNHTYGLNTKDKYLNILSLDEIKYEIEVFIGFVKSYPEKEWLLTKVGTGLSRYKIEDIAQLFVDFLPLPSNLVVPKEFYSYWSEKQLEIYKTN